MIRFHQLDLHLVREAPPEPAPDWVEDLLAGHDLVPTCDDDLAASTCLLCGLPFADHLAAPRDPSDA